MANCTCQVRGWVFSLLYSHLILTTTCKVRGKKASTHTHTHTCQHALETRRQNKRRSARVGRQSWAAGIRALRGAPGKGSNNAKLPLKLWKERPKSEKRWC
jgi:hypothetical protein